MNKVLLSLMLLISSSAIFAGEPVSKSYLDSIAIGGIDTTSYHQLEVQKSHKEIVGNSKFTVEWKDAKWHFASQQSADKFASDPERYQPTYNGFCSNALSLGEGLIRTNGTVWEFFDDRLHLFYAERGRQRWLNGDWKTYKQQADKAWAVLANK
ncbi:YHS domain-containing protein [Alginatibacterium sediminis]|uniref:YHS domain-containing protein n=1 Tax=Alginatibacterium sediminis TaxID=2164068 RepID=A0A420EAV1_9ALTE|nr:YHS domain-containing (seleno)protein [Alginatibacterium sediminis]RKF17783.1 YHS domain-containing protein [Alginatibacterium sediminis]